MEGAPAEDVPGASDAGKTGASAVRSPGDDQRRDDRNDTAGNGLPGGLGSRATKLDSPAGRGNDADPPGERSGGVDGARKRVKTSASTKNYHRLMVTLPPIWIEVVNYVCYNNILHKQYDDGVLRLDCS